MNCSKADELLMNYAENKLSESEFSQLKLHSLSCAVCGEKLKMYEEFSKIENPCAHTPDEFTSSVMLKISSEDNLKRKTFGGFIYLIWSVLSVVCGAGMLAISGYPDIYSLISRIPYFKVNDSSIHSLEIILTEIKNNIYVAADYLLSISSDYDVNTKMCVCFAFSLLLAVCLSCANSVKKDRTF